MVKDSVTSIPVMVSRIVFLFLKRGKKGSLFLIFFLFPFFVWFLE